MSPDQPLRILAVTNMYPTEEDPAYGAFVASQMDSVARLGHTVCLEFIDGRRHPGRYVAAVSRIGRLVRRGGVDLVHAHYGLTGFVAGFHRAPLVVSFCGDDLLGTPGPGKRLTWRSRLIRRLSGRAARRAEAIICKSSELRQALRDPRDRARAHVIPNGVDLDRFRPGDRARARVRLGIGQEEILVLFPHTPGEARKRADLAEAAVAHLRYLGIPGRLWTVTGVPQQQLAEYYHAANCLLLTSDWEGSPNVVKEALCCDIPVVAVPAGDAPEWVGLAPGSRVVARQAPALGAALRDVILAGSRTDGAEVRRRIGLDRIASALVQVYRQVATPPSR